MPKINIRLKKQAIKLHLVRSVHLDARKIFPRLGMKCGDFLTCFSCNKLRATGVDFVGAQDYSKTQFIEEKIMLLTEKGYDAFLAENIARGNEDILMGRCHSLEEARATWQHTIQQKAAELAQLDEQHESVYG